MQLQLLHIPLHRHLPHPSLLRLQVYRPTFRPTLQLTATAKFQPLRRTHRRRPHKTHSTAQTPHQSQEAAAEKKLQTTHQSQEAAEESQEALETSVGVPLTFATPKISSRADVVLAFAALPAVALKWIGALLSAAFSAATCKMIGENLVEWKKYAEAVIYFLSTMVDVWVCVLYYQRETDKAKVGKEAKVGEKPKDGEEPKKEKEPEGGNLFKSLKTLLWIQTQYVKKKEAQEEKKKNEDEEG